MNFIFAYFYKKITKKRVKFIIFNNQEKQVIKMNFHFRRYETESKIKFIYKLKGWKMFHYKPTPRSLSLIIYKYLLP